MESQGVRPEDTNLLRVAAKESRRTTCHPDRGALCREKELNRGFSRFKIRVIRADYN